VLDARPRGGRPGTRAPLRLPRRHAGAGGGPLEGRVRGDGVARAAHAAHVDQGLRGPPAGRGVRTAPRGAARVPHHRPGQHGPGGGAGERLAGPLPAGGWARAARHVPAGPRAPAAAGGGDAAPAADRQAPAPRPEPAGRLAQVFTNLLANAHRYTPDGGQITVAAAVSDEHVRVDVRDTGIGIAPDDQIQIFTKFFRGRKADEQTSGSGLGLAISRSLVDLHGGRITVASAPGAGSTFSVTLPRLAAPPAP